MPAIGVSRIVVLTGRSSRAVGSSGHAEAELCRRLPLQVGQQQLVVGGPHTQPARRAYDGAAAGAQHPGPSGRAVHRLDMYDMHAPSPITHGGCTPPAPPARRQAALKIASTDRVRPALRIAGCPIQSTRLTMEAAAFTVVHAISIVKARLDSQHRLPRRPRLHPRPLPPTPKA